MGEKGCESNKVRGVRGRDMRLGLRLLSYLNCKTKEGITCLKCKVRNYLSITRRQEMNETQKF